MAVKKRSPKKSRKAPARSSMHRGRIKAKGAKGGKVKASDVLGGISAAATGASALGFDAPITLPIAGLTGLASGILRLFGAGGITQAQMNALMRAERQGIVLSKQPAPPKKRVARKRKR